MKLAKFVAVATGVVALASSASAVPTLYITDGTVSLTVTDNSEFDSDKTDGVVTYNGALGANWTMSVSEGVSKPDIGSATSPELLLSSYSCSKGAGALTIMFSDDGFGPVSGTLVDTLGGTSPGSVTGQTFVDAGNVAGALTTALTPGLPLGGTESAAVTMQGPFSLTEVINIVHSGKGLTYVSEQLSVPDAALTLTMFGFGLIGLAVFGRAQKKAAV